MKKLLKSKEKILIHIDMKVKNYIPAKEPIQV